MNKHDHSRMHKNLPESVVELCPELYAIGGSVPLVPLPIWMPASSVGWLPMQCYAFRDQDRFILIDSATAALREEAKKGVRALAEGAVERRTLMTRREPDCAMNLPDLISDVNISLVECTSEINPLEFYSHFEDANTKALVSANTAANLTEFRMTRAGEKISIGPFLFEMLRPPIRVLSGSWLYEHSTNTLFCSDNFGFLTSDVATPPRSVTPAAADVSVERIIDFLAVKFDLLFGADTVSISRALTQIMDSRPVERLCPSYGLIIEGRSSVQRVIRNTIEAVEKLAGMTKPSEMPAFKANLALNNAGLRL